MKVIQNLENFPSAGKNSILTLGNFDGVHLGHQAILKRLKHLSSSTNSHSVVISFSEHTSQTLHPNRPLKLLSSLSQKLFLLEKYDVDFTILLRFNKEFAKKDFIQFIFLLKKHIRFSHLILGNNATFGRNRKGSPPAVQAIAKEQGFIVEYLDAFIQNAAPISSSRIRNWISSANFLKASQCLGRPYSILGKVIKGKGLGKKLGFPTANIEVENICLPPFGVYFVKILYKKTMTPGISNIGIAPSVRGERNPFLEVHLFKENVHLYGKTIEVFIDLFLRPERHFKNLEQLKEQIEKDIVLAKNYYKNIFMLY